MKLLIFFLFLVAGLSVRYHILLNVVLLCLLLYYSFKKFTFKFLIIGIVIFFFGLGISFIHLNFISQSYRGIVIESKDNYLILWSKFERLCIVNKNNAYEIGDIISLSGTKETLSFTSLESGFDFTNYLNRKGIYYQIQPKQIETIFSTPIRLKQIKTNFLNCFNAETKSLVGTILFGENDYSSLNSSIASLHLSRLFSIGGIYLVSFLKIEEYLLSFIFKEKGVKACSIIFLLVYSFITFPRFTILRFTLIRIIRWINDYLLKKKYDYLTILGFSGIFFLLIDYHLVYQDSFIIGYAITLLISIVSSSIKINKGIVGKIKLSLIVSIFFIPFELEYYHEISLLTPLLVFILTPLFLLYAFTALLCFIRIPLFSFQNYFTSGIKNTISSLNRLVFTIYAPPYNDLFIVIFYLFFFIILYYFSIRFKPLIRVSVISFISLLSFYFIPFKNFLTSEVCFINVGQGDSCLIRSGLTTILIDTGGSTYKDIAKECLIPYFKKKQIYQIDLLITTHDDYDHKGAYESLKTNFRIGKYITDYRSFPYSFNGITLENYNTFPSMWEDENDSSLVIGFNLKNKKFLIMGDAPIKIEKQIMKEYPSLKSDVLKVGHHGSNTSTCESFLDQIKPSEAIISVGQNKYGHPHQSVISLLKNKNIITKRTDQIGTITY